MLSKIQISSKGKLEKCIMSLVTYPLHVQSQHHFMLLIVILFIYLLITKTSAIFCTNGAKIVQTGAGISFHFLNCIIFVLWIV